MLAVPWSLSLSLLSACVAAFTDLRTRTIPNWLTLPLPTVALVVHGVLLGTDGLCVSLLGCVLCFLPAYFLFARGVLGGGDVKLFAAYGALLGPREGLEVELTAFMLVALHALGSNAFQGRLYALLRALARTTLHLLCPSRIARCDDRDLTFELPMGGAILCAVLALCARSLL